MKKFNFDDINDIVSQLPSKEKKISILLPYYNESSIIVQNTKTILQKTTEWGLDVEIVVSDDGSHDDGFSQLSAEFFDHPQVILVRSPRNYGKGRALSTAFEKSTGEYILFLDCDLELPIEHLPYFLLKIQDSDVVIGSKEDPLSQLDYPLIRRIFSKGYYTITKILFNLSVQDTQTGVKLFKREVLEKTLPYLLVKRFAFDIELLALINHYHYRIVSHPIVLQYTRDTQVGRMSLDTILHMFKDTFAVFWRLKNGFWQNVLTGKNSLRYVVFSFDINDKDKKDMFYIQDVKDIDVSVLEQYDVILFRHIDEEIPVFAFDTLDRIFVDSSIDGVLPLLYPMSNEVDEELYYSLMANMCFSKGYYPRYRPVRQGFIEGGVELPITAYTYKKDFFIQTLKNDKVDLSSVVHTPFYYIHKQLPKNDIEFEQFLKDKKIFGIKKTMRNIHIFCILLFIVGIDSGVYCFVVPWILFEMFVHLWYIYSLGIRKGIRYLILFDRVRFLNIVNIFKKIKK